MKQSTAMAIAASMACMPAVFAQKADNNVGGDSIAEINLQEVSIVAQRADAKTPIAFTNITASEIAPVNTGQDIPFLLGMAPSVVVTSDAGAGVGYSAIRVRGTDGSRINVTTNGIPVNDSESHNVYWVNLPDLASSLKDIQIQRGAGTSTNGAGAFGASINMVTETPSRAPYASIDASYGMYNTNKETLRLGTGLLRGHWAVDARVSHIGTDGYIDRASAELWSYFGQVGYYNDRSSLRFLAFGGKERTYMAWDYASKEDMEKYGRRYNPCGRYTDADGNTAYYPDQYDNYTTHKFQLIGKHRINSHLALDAALHFTKGIGYYEQYKTDRTLIEYGLEPFYVPAYDGDGNLVGTEKVKKSDLVRLKNMDNDFGGGLINLTYSIKKLDLVVGGAFNAYYGKHFGQVAWLRQYQGALNPLQEYYRNNGRKIDGNVYARANYAILPSLSAFADLQYRHIRYTIRGVSDTYDYNIGAMQPLDVRHNYDFFNPKVGFNYTFLNHNRLFASWSVAHREPTRDNFIDSAPDRQPVAERLFDYELGYHYTSGIVTAGVNLYYMDYKDQLVATGQLSDTGNAVSENVPSSYRAGIELQGSLRPVKWFDWTINATWSRNRIKNFVEYIYEDEWTNPITIDHGSTAIAFSPDFTLNNAFNFNWRGLDASLRSHYVSRQYLSNAQSREQSLDPYFVTDLVIGYTFTPRWIKSLRVGLTVNNLFNATYESNGYAGAGYNVDDAGEKVIYRYAGYAAQAPIHCTGSISITF